MAFVYRSQKSSPFESNSIKQSLHQQLPISETNYQVRIHERDPTLKKLITNKKCSKLQKKRKAEQPSIPNKQKVFDSLPPNVKKNQRYNFRFLKKSRVESFGKKNIDEDFFLKHKKQFYDLPGSLSHKSLVKYSNKVHSLNENKTPCQSPGPGSYNPQLVTSAQSPIFRDTTNFDVSLLKNKDSQSVEQKPEQNLFAVKYNYMNSRAFKKSLNLRKISNRILMSKLFSSQKNLHEKENNIPDQFTQVDEFRPGPGAYTEPTKSKNAPSFGNLERFKDKSPTSGSNKFYDVSIQNKDISQTSCFCSEVKRFDQDRVITQPLQYTNYDNSLIRDSHNKKDSGFKLDLGRIEEKVVDQRPYYELSQGEKMEFMTKFYKYEAKRQLFHNKSQASPGPEDYDTSLSWRKQHSCIINKDIKKYKACSQGSEPRQVNFYMCSHQNLHKKKQKGPKGVLKSSKLSQSPSPVKQQPSPQKYYETSPSWQIKTFNQRYINDILPANNPIKNKIL